MSKYAKTIYKYLDSVDIKHSNLGYQYLFDMIELIIEDPPQCKIITKAYQLIAERYETTGSCVEGAIRHTITNKNMTNKEFILKAAHQIVYRYNETA